jgi:hypothetical protein
MPRRRSFSAPGWRVAMEAASRSMAAWISEAVRLLGVVGTGERFVSAGVRLGRFFSVNLC